jgi:hypothetical protein
MYLCPLISKFTRWCTHSLNLARGAGQYWEEMARMWSLVPIPKGVHKLGELMVHDMSLGKALESLTPEAGGRSETNVRVGGVTHAAG